MQCSLKYCEFHQDFGHSTAECLILSGYLKEFLTGMRKARKFIEQDKGKRVTNSNPERKVPQGPKKDVYV